MLQRLSGLLLQYIGDITKTQQKVLGNDNSTDIFGASQIKLRGYKGRKHKEFFFLIDGTKKIVRL